jgi:hypothetical protein
MISRIPENLSTWLADWNLVTILRVMPPRDPNDDDDDAEDEEDEDDDDVEPPVIREPEADE